LNERVNNAALQQYLCIKKRSTYEEVRIARISVFLISSSMLTSAHAGAKQQDEE
jgi:hypothetical protein